MYITAIVTYIDICVANVWPSGVHLHPNTLSHRHTRKDETNPSTVNPLYNPGHTPDCERASTTETHNSRGYVWCLPPFTPWEMGRGRFLWKGSKLCVFPFSSSKSFSKPVEFITHNSCWAVWLLLSPLDKISNKRLRRVQWWGLHSVWRGFSGSTASLWQCDLVAHCWVHPCLDHGLLLGWGWATG